MDARLPDKPATEMQKSFASFLQKRRSFFLLPPTAAPVGPKMVDFVHPTG
jgi:hypothetical protein